MQTGHDGADGDVEDLRRVLVGEVADINEDDHVTEIVRHLGEGLHDLVLRQALDDSGLGVRPRVGFESVIEEIVAFLERLRRGRALFASAAVDVQIGEDPEEPGSVRPLSHKTER